MKTLPGNKYSMIETKNLYWLAGLLEGDGSFFKATNQGSPNAKIIVTMVSIDRDTVERVHHLTGIGTISGPYSSNRRYHKPIWRWSVQKQSDAAALMMTLYPLMHPRRQKQIRECIETWKHIPYYPNKLTEEDVKEIRRLYWKTSLKQREIAERFNISKQYVSNLINKTWRKNV